MNQGEEAEGGAWRSPDDRDRPLSDHLREHPGHLAVGATILALFVGVIILFRPFSPGTPTNVEHSALTPGAPLLGLSPGLAYDPIHRQIVLFNQLGQTWLFSGSSWSEAHPSVSPSGRIGAAIAWDPKLNAMLLFGGVVGEHGQPRDTWAWNGSSWRKLDIGAAAPPGGWAAMAYDSLHREMVLVVASGAPDTMTTETWSWVGSRWKEHSTKGQPAPEGIRSSLVFDPDKQVILAASLRCDSTTCAAETLTWDGSRWHNLTPPHEPDPSAYMEVLRDPASQRILLLTEGSTPPGVPAPTETWSWNGQDWTRVGTTGKAGGIVYAVPFEAGRPVVWAFEDVTPSAGAPRVDNAWILGIDAPSGPPVTVASSS
jgi:hypothetical protein